MSDSLENEEPVFMKVKICKKDCEENYDEKAKGA